MIWYNQGNLSPTDIPLTIKNQYSTADWQEE